MNPRLLLRTHYEAHEPRLIIAVVLHCSHPTGSTTEDRIAEKLKKWARENGYKISTPGAVYAVGNARHLGLLSKSYRWSSSGLAMGYFQQLMVPQLGEGSRILTPFEERYYLKLYLLGAGALLVAFGRWLVEQRSATDEQLRTGAVLKSLTINILDAYLGLAVDLRERTSIRQERERIRRIDYSAITSRHKRYPLLTTMERLNLLVRNTGPEENTVFHPDPTGRLAAFVRAIPDIETLEHLIRQRKLSETLDIAMREYERQDLKTTLPPTKHLLAAYNLAMSVGAQACPLSLLDDVLEVLYPASPTGRLPRAENLLEPLHKDLPREVRFHVDRKGERSFVILSAQAIERLKAS